ncbi:hypothetical protein ACH429_03760 [Streptomyces pathocidini]|uniref:DUF4199 domain-containing protein n=1 Tax=Streptomyces pathocidini TaxID=1650571 RepID=A0ABW7UNS9_9ACTN|nr:hypothetical protein [Streptomyces pathocidini]
MDNPGTRGRRNAATADVGDGTASQPGVIGIALAAVLAASLAQGSWQWFATYIGVTLLALILCFHRLPTRRRHGAAYLRNLTAYSMIVGLCVAIALAPMLQRWAWLFPMPGTRGDCRELGRYEDLRVEAALANLAGRDGTALARAKDLQSGDVVADCLAATTTRWLPVYAAAVAVLVGLGAWGADRARRRRQPAAASPGSPRHQG